MRKEMHYTDVASFLREQFRKEKPTILSLDLQLWSENDTVQEAKVEIGRNQERVFGKYTDEKGEKSYLFALETVHFMDAYNKLYEELGKKLDGKFNWFFVW